MGRAVRALVVLALGATASGAAVTAAAPTAPQVELRVAVTNSKIKPFGEAGPLRGDRPVRLRLFVDGTRIASKRVPLRNSGRFGGGFRSRDGGGCKVVAIYLGARDEREVPCSRPEFGSGTAALTGDDPTQIEVEIADTSPQHSHGLMYKRSLPDDRGMIFRFSSDRSGGFWMANTMIPLSIAFYDVTNTIVDILDMAPCYDYETTAECPTYTPGSPYRGALEVNQGMFDTWGVGVGDQILVEESLGP
jgi:uncharacterized membrane protein (UPF0127 family)